jgi:hypothetical protein
MLTPLRECDLSKIDLRTITLGQWEAVKREAHRRAHEERAKFVRDLANRLRSLWGRRNQPRDLISQLARD